MRKKTEGKRKEEEAEEKIFGLLCTGMRTYSTVQCIPGTSTLQNRYNQCLIELTVPTVCHIVKTMQ